jgi:AcrR family transcriptional regulator
VTESNGTKIGRPRSPAVHDVVCAAVMDLIQSGATLTSLSLVSIAQRTGISRNSLYRRWKSKEALYSDVVVSMKRSMPHLSEQSARENTITLLRVNFGRAGNELRMGQTIIAESQTFAALHDQYVVEIVAPFEHALKMAIRQGKETGEIRFDVDEHLLSEVLIATVLAWTTPSVLGSQNLDSSIQSMTDLVFDGVTTK